MSLPKRTVLRKSVFSIVALSALSFLIACGSSSPHGTAPPTGGFTNSNLSGTYAFSTTGFDINGCIMTIAGTFAANGTGGITGGTIDVVEPCFLTAPLQGASVTGGNYNVGADGRPESGGGTLTLTTQSNGSFVFDYVLASSNGGLITYYSTNSSYGGSGSGSFQLQTSVTQSSINGQSYAFSTSGESSTAVIAMAGAFTLDANGDVGVTTTGIGDVNVDPLATCGGSGCAITAGNITLSTTAGAPGTASFTLSPAGTFTFDVYPVTPTQLIFIETDGNFIATGTAFSQSSSIPVGNNVFAMAGIDASVSGGAPIASVGLLVTNGTNGLTPGASTQDVNDAGTAFEVTGSAITGSYTTPVTGRSVITLSGIINEAGLGCSNCQFAAYPSSGGILLLEIDDAGITSGVAYAQTASPAFASGQGYGLDLTGTNISSGEAVEEDDIAEFTNTSGALAGLIDFNDVAAGTVSTTFGQGYSGSYAADTSGIPGRGTVTSNNAYGMATYVVDSSTSVAVVNDGSGMIALGTLQTQAATSSSANAMANAAQQHLVALRASIVAGKHLKQQRKNR